MESLSHGNIFCDGKKYGTYLTYKTAIFPINTTIEKIKKEIGNGTIEQIVLHIEQDITSVYLGESVTTTTSDEYGEEVLR